MLSAKPAPTAHSGRLFLTLLAMLLTTTTTRAWSGQGTSADPYQIANANDLAQLATNVNGGTDYNNLYFKQTADITLSGAWTPIGTESHPFKGHYDGGSFAIRGLQVTGDYKYAGLFGYIVSGDYVPQLGFYRPAELKDINIVDCNINVGTFSDSNAGGIAGQVNTVLMSGCRVSGTITGYGNACGLTSTHATLGVSVTDCFVDVTVSGTGNQYNQYITPKVYQMIYTGAGTGGGSGNYYHDNGGSVAVSNATSISNSARSSTPLPPPAA
ncbi:MAG: hypothetical protein II404_13725 [Prevotella sp.]|nr:hypothetical protein [Prevotella sp.]